MEKNNKYEEHVCQHCGALTNQPDEWCFKKPPEPPREDRPEFEIIYSIVPGLTTVPPPKKGHGILKEWEVWSEGYVATGESGPAMLHGKFKARTFREACDICFFTSYLEELKKQHIEEPEFAPTRAPWSIDQLSYDRRNLTLWACRLFDNERDARKSYG